MKTKMKMLESVAVLLIPLLLFSGCSGQNKQGEDSSSGKNTDTEAGITTKSGVSSEAGVSTETGFDDGYGADDMEVVVADDPPELMEFESRSIGNATFTVESSKSTKIQYQADGKEKSISVTDDSGIEWTLEIPGNALLNEEEISITPLSGIEVDSFPGAEFHGILLKPDGLEFIVSSQISIKKEGETIEGVVLTGKHDGSDIVFSPADSDGGGLKAPVQHFSTLLYLPKSDRSITEIQSRALEQYEEALEEAEELLKKPLSVLAPPSISLECMNEEKEKQIKEYSDTVLKEEEEVLSKFIAADKGMWSTFESVEMNDAVIKKVLDRMNAKIQKLITQYEPDPEKFIAVFYTAISAWKQSSIFIETPELSVFQSWAEKTREHYMDKLNKNHELKAFSAALEIDRICSVALGMNAKLQEIINSMTFKLKIETDFYSPGFPITIKGEGILRPISSDTNTIYSMYDKTLLAQGSITLKYEYTGEDEDLTIEPEEFTVKAQVRNLNPCETDTLNILVEALGSDEETYVYEQTYGEYSDSYPLVNEDSQFHFEKEIKEVPYEIAGGEVIIVEMIDFKAALNNGQAVLAEDTFNRENTFMDKRIRVHLELEHIPGG
ncbi:MAG: hypothetical protein PHX37_04865 [Eubacteriales bacterium]|nr:hypothetical protein [Eubacteriales bacterium]